MTTCPFGAICPGAKRDPIPHGSGLHSGPLAAYPKPTSRRAAGLPWPPHLCRPCWAPGPLWHLPGCPPSTPGQKCSPGASTLLNCLPSLLRPCQGRVRAWVGSDLSCPRGTLCAFPRAVPGGACLRPRPPVPMAVPTPPITDEVCVASAAARPVT